MFQNRVLIHETTYQDIVLEFWWFTDWMRYFDYPLVSNACISTFFGGRFRESNSKEFCPLGLSDDVDLGTRKYMEAASHVLTVLLMLQKYQTTTFWMYNN